jgi:hypothetical protein
MTFSNSIYLCNFTCFCFIHLQVLMLTKWDPIRLAHISRTKHFCIGLMMAPMDGRNMLPEIPY